MESVTPEKIGELNRKLILDYVRKHGPVSRADIRRNLGMSFPTVSTNVKKLLESKHLLEAGDGDNPLGRKSTLLVFNCVRMYVIGIDIGRSQIRMMLADLSGDEVAYLKEACVDAEDKQNGITQQLCSMLDRVMEKGSVEASMIRCICIGIPGIQNQQQGKLMLAPFVRSLDLNEIIETFTERYGAPVLMDNSVNYGAIGEKWHGVANGHRDIVYINYGVGLGAALILNGELYRGVNNAAGEIGFMVPGREFIRTEFNEQGVLESLISGSQIREELMNMGLGEDIRNAMDRTGDGDAVYVEMIRKIVDTIGLVLINITAIFNEEVIVIGGGLGNLLGETFIPYWTKLLEAHVPFVPKILTSGLQHRANILGAIAVAIRYANDKDAQNKKPEL